MDEEANTNRMNDRALISEFILKAKETTKTLTKIEENNTEMKLIVQQSLNENKP